MCPGAPKSAPRADRGGTRERKSVYLRRTGRHERMFSLMLSTAPLLDHLFRVSLTLHVRGKHREIKSSANKIRCGKVSKNCGGYIVSISCSACSAPAADVVGSSEKASFTRIDEAESLLDGASRSLAKALTNPAARQLLRNDMRASKAHEHKIHLRRWLASDNARKFGSTDANAQAALSALTQLNQQADWEMYLPVRTHRRSWTPSSPLLVAVQSVEGSPIHAYNERGLKVALDESVAPEQPVLAIVHREMTTAESERSIDVPAAALLNPDRMAKSGDSLFGENLDDPIEVCPMDGNCEGGGGGGGGGGGSPPPPPTYPSGVYFDGMVLRDKKEPFTRGDPELEVHIFGTQRGLYSVEGSASSALVLIYFAGATREAHFSCSGRLANSWASFDINATGTYNFQQRLLSETQDFTIDERVIGPQGVLFHRRLQKLDALFTIRVIERDDGSECPTPPRKVLFNAGFSISTSPFQFRFTNAGFEDIAALFGNGNDIVSVLTVSSYAFFEQVGTNSAWLYGSDADLRVRSASFLSSSVPPSVDPWSP